MEENRFKVMFVQLDVLKAIEILKATMIQVNLNQMSIVDMIELHRQTREMVSHKLLQTKFIVKRLQFKNLRNN